MSVDTRRRSSRPERIPLGDDELVRNDVLAGELGICVRTLDSGDADGAPFIEIGSVKYRPSRGYQNFLASRIQRREPKPEAA